MLTDESYRVAIAVYIACACIALTLFLWWLRANTPRWLRIWLAATLAALLLTPALVQPGAPTLAPAFIVAGFQMMTGGVDSAVHALKPLALALGIAWVIALLLAVVWRPRPG